MAALIAVAVAVGLALLLPSRSRPERVGEAEAPPPEAPAAAAPNSPPPDKPPAGAAFHIGVVTGSSVQGGDELLGAREAIGLYGDAGEGGMIRHLRYPDNFITGMAETISLIAGLADDPLLKAIVVNQGIPGTAEAFRLVKAKRPDIVCLAAEAHEDPEFIADIADLVVNSDFISRGYLIPRSAKELGAKTFVHISFPRHMVDETISRRRAIMEAACGDLGLRFASENAPDPMGEAGIEGARKFITESFPAWIEKYGGETAFFCTNNAHTEPLLRQIALLGGYFVEADVPSPLLGYPGAFGIETEGSPAGERSLFRKIEEAVVKAGAAGRMGTWTHSLGTSHSLGLIEFGRLIGEGRAEASDPGTLIECYEKFTPGSGWNYDRYTTASSGRQLDNYVLAYQDTYVFGKGHLGSVNAKVPEKYRNIRIGAPSKKPDEFFHIGIVTGDVTQGADDYLGAREMIRLYGDALNGGMIRHAIYPDNFMDDAGRTVRVIADLADDPLMRVIVVNQAVPGTGEGFRRVKERNPGIVCLAGEAHEEIDELASGADLVVNADFIARGYLIPLLAKRLGARTLVHLSFPRHLGYHHMARRRSIMRQACRDLGLAFADEEAPDPTGSAGIEGARRFILENFPAWIEKYGADTAFFCTNDAHTEPVLEQVAASESYFVEADLPSPILGYPQAFGIDIDYESGDWQAILRKVEEAVAKAGGNGRLGTWAYPLGVIQTAGMAEFGRLIAQRRVEISDMQTLLECFGKFSPGATWNGSYYMDDLTAKPVRKYFLVYQDTYVFGKGYMGTAGVEIPMKYLLIGVDHEVREDAEEGL
jgi:DNA-binding LacI/PurR family transcriptional regulator